MPPLDLSPAIEWHVLDLPALRSCDARCGGVYLAASRTSDDGPAWRPVSFYWQRDGTDYELFGEVAAESVLGAATTVLADGATEGLDLVSTVQVQLFRGSLATITDEQLERGGNLALLGSELVQFRTVSDLGDGLYELSDLARGRRGTEQWTDDHAIGEPFVLLEQDLLAYRELDLADGERPVNFKAAAGESELTALADLEAREVLLYHSTLRPFAPVCLAGTRSGGDLTVTWKRRTREIMGARGLAGLAPLLDGDRDDYEVEILNGSDVVRIISVTGAETTTYTSAQQTADFGSAQDPISLRIYQLSHTVGRGFAAEASL